MYSYEDRVRAIELGIKLGQRLRTAIRQLGYPIKNVLKGWHREFEKRLDCLLAMQADVPVTRRRRRAAVVSASRFGASPACRNFSLGASALGIASLAILVTTSASATGTMLPIGT